MGSLLTFALVVITVAEPAVQKTIEVLKNEGINRHSRVRRDGPIVFRGASSEVDLDVRARFGPSSPPTPIPCPNDQNFCEDVANYPTELLDSVLKKYASSKFLMGQFFVEEVDSDINRFGEDDSTPLCIASSQVIYPKVAKTTEGDFLFVLNTEKSKQGVKVEVCQNATNDHGSECNIPGTLSNGYSSQCVQRYIKRTLVVLKNYTEGLVLEPFDIPSCCSCTITKSSLNNDRFGGNIPSLGVNRFGSGIPSDGAEDAIPHRASPQIGSTFSGNNSAVSAVFTSSTSLEKGHF